jgi:hypothetical protein
MSRDEIIRTIVVVHINKRKEILKLNGDYERLTEEPIYELSVIHRAAGRLVVVRLNKYGECLREMEVYRRTGHRQPGWQGGYSLLSAHSSYCGTNHIQPEDYSEFQGICRCLLHKLRVPEQNRVTTEPLEYVPIWALPWNNGVLNRPTGAASVYLQNESEPPELTGEETTENLKTLQTIASRRLISITERGEFEWESSRREDWEGFLRYCRQIVVDRETEPEAPETDEVEWW